MPNMESLGFRTRILRSMLALRHKGLVSILILNLDPLGTGIGETLICG